MIVTGQPVADFMARTIGTVLFPPFEVIGIERDGDVVAGLAFNCWTGPDIHISAAAKPGCLSRALLRAGRQYVFKIAGCVRATIITESPVVA
jgi:hypothetical protein